VTYRLSRRYGAGHLHFITCSCSKRRPLLGSATARDCFIEKLSECRARFGFSLIGYVVMPEHVHLLISEPPQSSPSEVMRELKRSVALSLLSDDLKNKHSTQALPSNVAAKDDGDHFWLRRFYDFNVCTRQKRNEKLHYMHLNPVKRALVRNPKDWRWSSYRF
jgi:putative transposase